MSEVEKRNEPRSTLTHAQGSPPPAARESHAAAVRAFADAAVESGPASRWTVTVVRESDGRRMSCEAAHPEIGFWIALAGIGQSDALEGGEN